MINNNAYLIKPQPYPISTTTSSSTTLNPTARVKLYPGEFVLTIPQLARSLDKNNIIVIEFTNIPNDRIVRDSTGADS